jgi:hypothetical protein
VFDLYFDLSWRGASGLWGGGRGVASTPAGFASFSGLSFLLFGLGIHVGVICGVGLASLRSSWLPSLIPGEGRYLTSLFDKLQTIDSCDKLLLFFAGVAITATGVY